MHCSVRLVAFIAAIPALLLTSNVQAASVRPVNLVELVNSADRVFLGKCLRIEHGFESVLGLPVSRSSFVVEDAPKGVRVGDEIRITQIRLPNERSSAQFRPGETVLLFLYEDSQIGLTSPVGLAQGVFRLRKTRDGQIGLMNAFRNGNLVLNINAKTAQQYSLTSDDLVFLELDLLPARRFLSMIRQIDGLGGSEDRQ